jgi:membrane protease YdiL (CAAX protease family)
MKSYPTYLQSFGLLLIFLLCTILSVIVVLPFFSFESGIGMTIIYTLSISLTIIIALFIRKDFTFPFKWFSPWIVVIGSLAILCAQLALEPVTNLIPLSDIVKKMIEETIQQPIAFFIMAVLAAPLFEELLFRGVILHGLLKNYQPWKAILFSAFLFALVHGNLSQGVGAFMGGILMGWIYWKTQSVLPGILIHLINNLASFVGVMLTPEADIFKSTQEIINNDLVYVSMVFGCAAMAIAAIWLLQKKYLLSKEIVSNSETIN